MSKRGPGRPPGEKIDDSKDLEKLAEFMLESPSIRPTTAIKKMLGVKRDKDVRRLQGRWKARELALLAQARAKRERAVRRAVSPGASGGAGFERYPPLATIRALVLGFSSANPLDQVMPRNVGMSLTQQIDAVLGRHRSYADAYDQIRERAADVAGAWTISKLINIRVSSGEELSRLADAHRIVSGGGSQVNCGTDRLLDVAHGMYGLARKYG